MIYPLKMLMFHIVMLVYQRVIDDRSVWFFWVLLGTSIPVHGQIRSGLNVRVDLLSRFDIFDDE